MGDKRNVRLPEDLAAVQKMLRERSADAVVNGGLSSQIIDFFPYPIAIFTPQYTLTLVNKAFAAETGIRAVNIGGNVLRILQYRIDDARLAMAVTKVFEGDTFFLEEIREPFSMFSGTEGHNRLRSGRFSRVVVFPVHDDDRVTHGGIAFLP